MKNLFFLFLITSLLSACTNLFQNDSYSVKGLDKDKLHIIVTHNINGETHPCGCRHFPLGGLPQVAGKLAELQKEAEVIFVDVGDTFFPTIQVPKSQEGSQLENAKGLSSALSDIGLKFHVPGDYDLAPGIEEYKKIIADKKFRLLVANLKDSKLLPHQRWALFEKGPHKIALIGLVNPDIYPSSSAAYFSDPKEALKKAMDELKKEGIKVGDPFTRIIVFSHSGMDFDEKLAKEFEGIDWIVGAHTQNFTTHPQKEGMTQIVQVLSKNHYLGNITLAMNGSKDQDTYSIIEIRDELADLLKPNPWTAWIDQHKNKINEIKANEMSHMVKSDSLESYMTARSCMDCHSDQSQKWMQTPHALAFVTLLNANEANNPSCIGCHTLGFQDPQGFSRMEDMVRFEGIEEEKKNDHLANYLKDLKSSFSKIKSVRELSEKDLVKHSKTWQKIEEKYKVADNHMNVQCLNCHSFVADHPFDDKSKRMPREMAMDQMKSKCLTCHIPDQAPEWYLKKENGLPGALDEKLFLQKLKSVACPSMSK